MNETLSQQQAKDIARLRIKKYREAEGRMLLEGERLVTDVLQGGSHPELVVIEDDRFDREEALRSLCASRGVPVLRAGARLMQKITDTRTPQGIAAVIGLPGTDPMEALEAADPGLPLFALHGVSDPGNLGTVLRTTEWFGGASLLLSADSVEPFNPKVVRASMGSVLRLHIGIYREESWLSKAARLSERTLAATVAQGGSEPGDLRGEMLLAILGSEAHGLPSELLAQPSRHVTIPGSGTESLNVAIAHAILSYAWRT